MLLQLKRDFDALVVCYCTVEAVVHQRIGDFHSSGEDLIQVTTQPMGDGALINSTGEVQEVQLSQHMWHVIVEITTYDQRSVRVLFDDILDDISHSLCSLFQVWLLTWLQVAV